MSRSPRATGYRFFYRVNTLVVFSSFMELYFCYFRRAVGLITCFILSVGCSSPGPPNGFLKACPDAPSESLGHPLCNRLFKDPKLGFRQVTGSCYPRWLLGMSITTLQVIGLSWGRRFFKCTSFWVALMCHVSAVSWVLVSLAPTIVFDCSLAAVIQKCFSTESSSVPFCG